MMGIEIFVATFAMFRECLGIVYKLASIYKMKEGIWHSPAHQSLSAIVILRDQTINVVNFDCKLQQIKISCTWRLKLIRYTVIVIYPLFM